MVDKIGNGSGYNYSTVNEKRVNTNAAGTGEKFHLDYGKEGAIYEPSSEALKRQQAENGVTTKTQDTTKAEADGVRLTLSNATAEHSESTKNQSNVAGGGILDALTSAVNRMIDTIKSFFSSIWNDEPVATEKTEQDVQADPIKAEKPKTEFEKAKAEAEAFLASAEGKKVARNSDLLTYYDKHGSVVSVSPSDRQRILYGDKNQIEV